MHAPATHPRCCFRRDGSIEALNRRGPIIGLGDGLRYEQWQVELAAGDKVLIYTDGVLENRGTSGEAFGRERFRRALQRSSGLPVEELVQALQTELREFPGNTAPDDDISILGLEYTGRDFELGPM